MIALMLRIITTTLLCCCIFTVTIVGPPERCVQWAVLATSEQDDSECNLPETLEKHPSSRFQVLVARRPRCEGS